MVFVYLDIDGVLTTPRNKLTSRGLLEFSKESVDVLKSVLDKYNGKIIVSSSWKEYKSVEFIKENYFMDYDLDKYIIGKTPDISSIDRSEEIVKDMNNRNLNLKDILILDDIELEGDLVKRHIQTNLYEGLTKYHLSLINVLLERR